jgi:hypothetical protein
MIDQIILWLNHPPHPGHGMELLFLAAPLVTWALLRLKEWMK